MTTPNPRGYPHQSALVGNEHAVVEHESHWSFDECEHNRQQRINRNIDPLSYMTQAKRLVIQAKLDDLFND